jgi:hypothetical protein
MILPAPRQISRAVTEQEVVVTVIRAIYNFVWRYKGNSRGPRNS